MDRDRRSWLRLGDEADILGGVTGPAELTRPAHLMSPAVSSIVAASSIPRVPAVGRCHWIARGIAQCHCIDRCDESISVTESVGASGGCRSRQAVTMDIGGPLVPVNIR